MTAKQRYAQCKTIEELDFCYEMNIMSADTWEFLNACENAYKDRYRELRLSKEDEHK